MLRKNYGENTNFTWATLLSASVYKYAAIWPSSLVYVLKHFAKITKSSEAKLGENLFDIAIPQIEGSKESENGAKAVKHFSVRSIFGNWPLTHWEEILVDFCGLPWLWLLHHQLERSWSWFWIEQPRLKSVFVFQSRNWNWVTDIWSRSKSLILNSVYTQTEKIFSFLSRYWKHLSGACWQNNLLTPLELNTHLKKQYLDSEKIWKRETF